MRYISPKTDFAFRKIFGSEGSQGILMSFLNAVLYEGEPCIESLEILDPYSIPRVEGMKDSYLDVRVKLRGGQIVLIEMQVLNIPGLEKRILYNAAKEYSSQLTRGQDYHMLNPVIALTLTDFIMFPELEGQVITRFALLEKSRFIAYPEGDVELVFVELPKFQREVGELRSLTEKWLYFVRRAADLERVPDDLGKVREISEAFSIAEFARLSPDEERALDKKVRWIADQKSLLEMSQNIAAKLEMQTAKLEVQTAELEMQTAKFDLQSAELEVQSAELEMQTAKTNKAEEKAERAQAEAERAQAEAARAQAEAERVERELTEQKQLAEQEAARTAQAEAGLRSAVVVMLQMGMKADDIAVKLGLSLAECLRLAGR